MTPVSDWDGKTDDEYLQEYVQNNQLSLTVLSRYGKGENLEYVALTPETDYYIFVFGYDQNVITTDVTKLPFTTISTDNPEDLSFEFYTNNATSTSVDVKIIGTPDQALYYWDIVDASATQEEAMNILEGRIQRWLDIGRATDRVSIFKEQGAKGTIEETVTYYNFGYSYIEPGKEYKLYAVGIYDETGEYATDFFFSEPFTTPLQ